MPAIGIEQLATNVIKVYLAIPAGRAVILFSYSTPVALALVTEEALGELIDTATRGGNET